MAKGQQKSNRETKKPKKNKKPAGPPSFTLSTGKGTPPMPPDKKK